METKKDYIDFVKSIASFIFREYGYEWEEYHVANYIKKFQELNEKEDEEFILRFTNNFPHSWNISQVARQLNFKRDTKKAMAYLALKDDVIDFLENFGEDIVEDKQF